MGNGRRTFRIKCKFFFFFLNFISWLGTLRFGVQLPKYGEGLAATPFSTAPTFELIFQIKTQFIYLWAWQRQDSPLTKSPWVHVVCITSVLLYFLINC